MKHKFSSMGRVAIALVLALSLTLVMAVPVSAAEPTIELDEAWYGIAKQNKVTVTVVDATKDVPVPVMDELAEVYDAEVKFTKVDVDQHQKYAGQLGIRSTPTILYFKDGKVVDNVIGAVPKGQLEDKIKEHK